MAHTPGPGASVGDHIVPHRIHSSLTRRRPTLASAFEPLEPRKLLSAAAHAAAPKLVGEVYDNDNGGYHLGFVPRQTTLGDWRGFLTGRQGGRRADLARQYISENAAQLGITPEDARSSQIVSQYTDAHNGVTHVWFQQMYNGLPVSNASLGIHFMPDGRVINVTSTFVPLKEAPQTAGKAELSGMLHPTLALRKAAEAVGVDYSRAPESIDFIGGNELKFEVEAPTLSYQTIPMEAEYFATPEGVRLVWNTNLDLTDGSSNWYEVSVDAKTGQAVYIDNYTNWLTTDEEMAQARVRANLGPAREVAVEPTSGGGGGSAGVAGTANAVYNVYAIPKEAPFDGPRTLEADPWLAAGTGPTSPSPYGWHDTNGVAGDEFNDTRGNNVSAQEDRDANNTGGFRPSGGTLGGPLNFDFPIDFTQAPIAYESAAITNLFYWNNVIHDVMYKYGFTEAARNFQTNNYGRGGLGNDAVQADAQDGSGTNNANFSTPADGTPGRMQMFIWTAPNPDLDGDLDNGIIAHEYGHGISNRNTGTGSGSITATQSRGMGEGWSDFYSLMFTQKATDTQNGSYGIGTYALNQPPTGVGIRLYPYSWDTSINPITWGYYGSGTYTDNPYIPGGGSNARSTAVHRTGTIWNSCLWDLNWLLRNKHGFDENLYTGYNPNGTPAERAGNKLLMQLVMDGFKLQGANPSFTVARDAILQADTVLTGGQNHNEIWTAFARRGLGDGAVVGTSSSTTNLTLSYVVPWPDPIVNQATPTGNQLGSVSTMRFVFNQSMNPSSFSIADDVVSLIGPGGVDYKSALTGFSWINATTLEITANPLNAVGSYTIVIGPNILSADDGRAMDQDRDGTPGENPDDTYAQTFSVTRSLGPDGGGYQAIEFPMEPIDLVIGEPGVVTLVNGSDDAAGTITLPVGTTFTYYGTQYSTVFANANGLITFGTSSTAFTNGDLTSTPSQAAIGALWDDWRTDRSVAGQPDSAVLYKIDGDKLIIEWSDVHNRSELDGSVTFQAILQLNTGSTNGRIRANYPDITTNNATQSSGASSTVGIKNSGTQGASRLLVAQNTNANAWVQTGKALIFGPDVIAPEVSSANYTFETDQRLDVGFSEDVGASFVIGNVVVRNLTTETVLDRNVTVSYDGPSNTGRVELVAASLPDGDYRVTLLSDPFGNAGVADAAGNALDGERNGVAGGNYQFEFFFLRGDANRDRLVNIADFSILAGNFNTNGTFSDGDFDYNGQVNIADFSILASKFNTGLASRPGASAPVAASGGETRLLAAADRSPFRSGQPVWSEIDTKEVATLPV